MVSFLNKVAILQACNFIKRRLKHRCFTVNIAKFSRALFYIEHLPWLHLWFLSFNPWVNNERYFVTFTKTRMSGLLLYWNILNIDYIRLYPAKNHFIIYKWFVGNKNLRGSTHIWTSTALSTKMRVLFAIYNYSLVFSSWFSMNFLEMRFIFAKAAIHLCSIK